MFRESTPIFVENSKIPVFLSKFAPININAITLGPVVFSRGAISKTTRRHETIHWQQYIETGVIGFVLLYPLFWLIGLLRFRSGKKAYQMIPFEQEAYANQRKSTYLSKRKRYVWLKSIWLNNENK